MGCNCGGGRTVQPPTRAQSNVRYTPSQPSGGGAAPSPGYAQQSNPNRATPAQLPAGSVVSPRTVV